MVKTVSRMTWLVKVSTGSNGGSAECIARTLFENSASVSFSLAELSALLGFRWGRVSWRSVLDAGSALPRLLDDVEVFWQAGRCRFLRSLPILGIGADLASMIASLSIL